MSGDELERDQTLARVRMDRRGFIKKLVVGAAFTSPVVASFAMSDNALGTARHLAQAAYSTYTPTSGLQHFGHRGYGPYAYTAYPFDLDISG